MYTDPALALEYYMLAADAMGGSVQVGAGHAASLSQLGWALAWLRLQGPGPAASRGQRDSRATSTAGRPGGTGAPANPASPHPHPCQVKGQLLRELLVESKAFGYLLGSGGAGQLWRRRCWPAVQPTDVHGSSGQGVDSGHLGQPGCPLASCAC